MRQLDQQTFDSLLKHAGTIKPRIKRDVRFGVSTNDLRADDWAMRELLPVYDKSKNKGIMLLQPYDTLYMVAFEIGRSAQDGSTGRTRSVICDFCYTWRTGSDAGLVTFYADSHSHDSTSQLCCFDLQCSQNVRTATNAGRVSRAQLREHLTDDERVERLRRHLQKFIDKVAPPPVTL